jgi:hypothetical protein
MTQEEMRTKIEQSIAQYVDDIRHNVYPELLDEFVAGKISALRWVLRNVLVL